MVDSPNIELTHVEQSQIGKEASINLIADRADTSNNDTVDVVCTAGGTVTVTDPDKFDNILIRLTGSPAGAFTLDVPDGKRALHFENDSGQTATIETVTGAAATINLTDGQTVAIDFVGTDYTVVGVIGDGTGVTGSTFGRVTEILPVEAWFAGSHGSSNNPGALETLQGSANGPAVQGVPFDTTTEEFLHLKFALPSRWDKGTVTFSTVYLHKGSQTGGLDGVTFDLRAVQIADGAVHDGTFGSPVSSSLDPGVLADALWNTAESTAVTVGGTLADSLPILWAISRSGGDLDIDAYLVEVHLHWTEDAAVDD